MNFRLFAPSVAVALLGFAPFTQAHADTFFASGNFAADNSVYTYAFTNASTQTYTFATTSFAMGGFDPVLTLFSDNGAPVDNFGSGTSDATLTENLGSGSYTLALTEFPNVAIGTLSQGFLFAGEPTVTGDNCGVADGMFLDSVSCTQLGSNYALEVTSSGVGSTAVTPEPSSWLLLLSGALGMFYLSRRRIA